MSRPCWKQLFDSVRNGSFLANLFSQQLQTSHPSGFSAAKSFELFR